MFRLAFLAAILLVGFVMWNLTSSVPGSTHEAEIEAVRNSPVERIAHTGMNDSESLDAWIAQEFYVGRFEVWWSATDIDAGKVRVSADMSSNSELQLERSIVLRFDVDAQSKKVTFAGMMLEGAAVAAANGKPYSLEEAMATMWERRNEVYLLDPSDLVDPSDDSDS